MKKTGDFLSIGGGENVRIGSSVRSWFIRENEKL